MARPTDILSQIAAEKRTEVELLKSTRPLQGLIDEINDCPRLDFKKAISTPDQINIIAELKKGSPSKGVIRSDFNPMMLAEQYLDGGAAALSVLTEEKYFFGRHEYMGMAKGKTSLPILCKDFIIDSYQLYYARLMKADAILLIVKLLPPDLLERLIDLAAKVGLDCLVETHDQAEVETALQAGAEIIGVNSRNLSDFSVDIKRAEKLASLIPTNVIKVAESGIGSVVDISRLKKCGYDAFLIGETLVSSSDPAGLLRQLRSA